MKNPVSLKLYATQAININHFKLCILAKVVEKETRKFRFQLSRGRKVRPLAQDTGFDRQLDQRIQRYRSLAFKK